MADLRGIHLPAPVDGMDIDSAPDSLPLTKAVLLTNYLIDLKGTVYQRGPIYHLNTFPAGPAASSRFAGFAQFGNVVAIGLRKADATAVRDPWAAPLRPTASSAALSLADDTVLFYDRAANTWTTAAKVNGLAPGSKGVRVGDFAYCLAFSSNEFLTYGGAAFTARYVCRFDGTGAGYASVGAGVAPVIAPRGAIDIESWNERLWVLGGVAPGTALGGASPWAVTQANYSFRTLYFTDAGGPIDNTVGRWQDDISGFTNKIVVGVDDPNDPGVAIARCQQNLLVLCRRSAYVVSGYSASTYSVKQISSNIGCVDQRSVVAADEGCYFMSDRGFMFFDGAQLRNLSDGVRTGLDVIVRGTQGIVPSDGYMTRAAQLDSGAIIVEHSFMNPTTNAETYIFAGVYYPALKAWTILSVDAAIGIPSGYVRMSLGSSLGIAQTKVYDLSFLDSPFTVAASDRGLDHTSGGGTVAINTQWTTRIIPLAAPLMKSQLHRIVVQYLWQLFGKTDANAGNAMTVTVTDQDGNTLISGQAVPAQGDPTAILYENEAPLDVFNEAKAIQITFLWQPVSQTQAVSLGQMTGVTVEYQPTRQR